MGILDQGPRYTLNDLVYYTGLFGGIIAVYLTTRPYVHPLIALIGGLVVGVGLGYALERAYARTQEPGEKPPPPEW